MSKPKVLLSVYACNPNQGSEHAVGWGLIEMISTFADLTVITETKNNKHAILKYLQREDHRLSDVKFHFIEKKRNETLRRLWPPSYYWFYRRWQLEVYQLAMQLNAEQKFDIFHQGNMVGFREPGYLSKIGTRCIWGPIGGLGYFPLRFASAIGLVPLLYYVVYNLLNYFDAATFRRPYKTAVSNNVSLLAATKENQSIIKSRWNTSSEIFQEIGISKIETSEKVPRSDNILKIIWVGQVIPRKALGLAIWSIFKASKYCDVRFHIVGDGPLLKKHIEVARNLGISNLCNFHGKLSRSDTISLIKKSDVMLITSLRDLNSVVTVEALSSGVPVIAPDHCGFSDVLNDDCGFLIPTDSPSALIEGIVSKLLLLSDNPKLLNSLSNNALERANDFLWSQKCKKLYSIYKKILK
jgi:glycosyltransferase involved in cell wall biosynthesis